MAMLIPSIDLMAGKIVQLVQGQCKALEFDNFDDWVTRFSFFPMVQLIDLDAAMETGTNEPLIRNLSRRLPCQVGGGIRSLAAAQQALAAGARRVIIGSRLIRDGNIDLAFAAELATNIGPDHLVFAVDTKNGQVTVRGWKEQTTFSPEEMIHALDPYCAAFLYTNVDTEGLMQGLPLDPVKKLRAATHRQLIVAGGISSMAEVDTLHALGMDAVVGMALYSGHLPLPKSKNTP
jgi:phosphoribosylformimino-5-aminoimidazole carboxamide ribotide isomerase